MKPDWDAFCDWIREDMELPNLPIEWSRILSLDGTLIRFDICKDRAYHVTTAVEDRPELYTHDVAYELAQGLLTWLGKAIQLNSPCTYIRYFPLEYMR